MAVIQFPDTNLSISTRGIVGRPIGAGYYQAGYSWVGDDFMYSGIYQSRARPTGRILIKMRHYRSPNPQTAPQQAWRAYFKDVMLVWHNLDNDLRVKLRKSHFPHNMGGWNRYARLYMRRKPTDAGVMRAGLCFCGGLTTYADNI